MIQDFQTFNESTKDDSGYEKIEILYRGEVGFIELIKYIRDNGSGGHSFSIVVDPKDEREKVFGYDGDGSDNIKEIKIDGKVV